MTEQSDIPLTGFVRVNPNENCVYYATGQCCRDFHLRAESVFPQALRIEGLCEHVMKKPDLDYGNLTDDKSKVNCKDCLEIIHA